MPARRRGALQIAHGLELPGKAVAERPVVDVGNESRHPGQQYHFGPGCLADEHRCEHLLLENRRSRIRQHRVEIIRAGIGLYHLLRQAAQLRNAHAQQPILGERLPLGKSGGIVRAARQESSAKVAIGGLGHIG